MKSNYNNQSSNLQEDEEELLTLTLSTKSANPLPNPPPPPHVPPSSPHQDSTQCPSRPPRRHRRGRSKQSPSANKSDTIPPPYPWATDKRATVHTLHHLLSNGLDTISGQVQCKKCDKIYDIEYDLKDKFMEVASFISNNKGTLHHRAPHVWRNPNFPSCKYCEQHNCVKPILLKKRSINWLFLLLGQMLGCCKLAQLKYFCKHTKNHRTGAKDRVLYLTYLCLCKQLDPEGPFAY